MVSIFDFSNYREYLGAWIASQANGGYGLKGKIATALGISSSLVSQVLKGDKTLTADQASDLCDFMGLNEIESDFLHLLIEADRTGSHRYREKLKKKIAATQVQSRRIGKRVPRHKELTEEQKGIYYSSWLYTATRNLVAVPGFDQTTVLADYLQVKPQVLSRVIRFLVENGLLIEENGKLAGGPASTHVDRESPFANKHHQNWRLQALQMMEQRRDEDIFFTSPMSLSRQAAEQIRTMLPTVIQEVMKISGPSPSEMTACLAIDWFEY